MDTRKTNQLEEVSTGAAEERVENQEVSRRDFTRLVGGAAGATAIGSILAACTTPTPGVEVTRDGVVETVVVTATPSREQWEQAVEETRQRLSEEELEFLERLARDMLEDDSFAREFASCPRAVLEEYGLDPERLEGAAIDIFDEAREITMELCMSYVGVCYMGVGPFWCTPHEIRAV